MKAKAKIELGDIYLLKEESWEATLLYSQVEKTQRETPLGYEAKLRNARLSYFKGDFLLAQEHLDILKQATSREIANDAMKLSMLIKENTIYDTTGAALKEFASIELLLAQNKNNLALQRLQNFKVTRKEKMSRQEALSKNLYAPDKSVSNADSVFVDVEMDFSTIQDDVYWLEANLLLKKGDFVESIATLEKIITEFGEDILSDDAYFLEGEIYEQQLKNNNKAMEIYREFLDRYPGSVYAAEARKRYRHLRGDFNEPEITPKF
jgi:tetratricopeptide (TPR) repeat protein